MQTSLLASAPLAGFPIGCRIRVLRGRNFTNFREREEGVVLDVNENSCNCLVAFDGREDEPVFVAFKHLKISPQEEEIPPQLNFRNSRLSAERHASRPGAGTQLVQTSARCLRRRLEDAEGRIDELLKQKDDLLYSTVEFERRAERTELIAARRGKCEYEMDAVAKNLRAELCSEVLVQEVKELTGRCNSALASMELRLSSEEAAAAEVCAANRCLHAELLSNDTSLDWGADADETLRNALRSAETSVSEKGRENKLQQKKVLHLECVTTKLTSELACTEESASKALADERRLKSDFENCEAALDCSEANFEKQESVSLISVADNRRLRAALGQCQSALAKYEAAGRGQEASGSFRELQTELATMTMTSSTARAHSELSASTIPSSTAEELFDAAESNDVERLRTAMTAMDLNTVLALRNNSGRSILHAALASGAKEPVHCILESLRVEATRQFYAHEVQGELLQRSIGTALNCQDDSGMTPLFLHAVRGDTDEDASKEVTLDLIRSRADPSHKSAINGATAMLVAAGVGNSIMVNMLLDISRGFALYDTDDQNRTALHLAAAAGCEDVVSLLISARVDTELVDDNGCAAMAVASEAGHERVIWLLEHGAMSTVTSMAPMEPPPAVKSDYSRGPDAFPNDTVFAACATDEEDEGVDENLGEQSENSP